MDLSIRETVIRACRSPLPYNNQGEGKDEMSQLSQRQRDVLESDFDLCEWHEVVKSVAMVRVDVKLIYRSALAMLVKKYRRMGGVVSHWSGFQRL